MKDRIGREIQHHDDEQTRLLNEAEKNEKKAAFWRAILDQAWDKAPDPEALIQTLLEPPAPQPPPITKQPEPVTDRVQVTRELVHAAVAMLGRVDFRVDHVYEKMTDGRKVNDDERRRIRSSIVGAIYQLIERGEVEQTQKGIGRRPAFFRLR